MYSKLLKAKSDTIVKRNILSPRKDIEKESDIELRFTESLLEHANLSFIAYCN